MYIEEIKVMGNSLFFGLLICFIIIIILLINSMFNVSTEEEIQQSEKESYERWLNTTYDGRCTKVCTKLDAEFLEFKKGSWGSYNICKCIKDGKIIEV